MWSVVLARSGSERKTLPNVPFVERTTAPQMARLHACVVHTNEDAYIPALAYGGPDCPFAGQDALLETHTNAVRRTAIYHYDDVHVASTRKRCRNS